VEITCQFRFELRASIVLPCATQDRLVDLAYRTGFTCPEQSHLQQVADLPSGQRNRLKRIVKMKALNHAIRHLNQTYHRDISEELLDTTEYWLREELSRRRREEEALEKPAVSPPVEGTEEATNGQE
jgi:hypothetical protein